VDHRAVTDVIARLVDGTQEMLAEEYAPGIGTVDAVLGDLDERIAVFTLGECRDSAWRNAVALNSRLPVRRRLARWITHATATGTAYLVLSSRGRSAVHGSPGTRRRHRGTFRGVPLRRPLFLFYCKEISSNGSKQYLIEEFISRPVAAAANSPGWEIGLSTSRGSDQTAKSPPRSRIVSASASTVSTSRKWGT